MVGFFRRICKLLFFGVKPVFVFDGGAPALKRRTVGRRKERREGRREDAVRTAGKLLAVQMQRRMKEEEEEQARKREKGKRNGRGEGGGGATERDGEGQEEEEEEEEEALPENLVYVEELQMTPEERQRKRQNKFRKKDAYHLPELETPLAEMGAPNDPRIMSMEELQTYARQFDSGEDINIYDFSKIDFDSPFFQSLPDSDRYNILNAARLRSRLRMGYSKDQLDTMFPDRMAFSKFQIDRVRERNELTQRLMNINGMNGDDAATFGFNNGGRVAGEKGREYVLVKNDGVEGGWALGVVDSKDEGKARDKPIDVDELHKRRYADELDDDDDDGANAGKSEEEDDGFEDVPVEGLNRLPKRPAASKLPSHGRSRGFKRNSKNITQNHSIVSASQRQANKVVDEEAEDSLFLAENEGDSEMWEDVHIGGAGVRSSDKSEVNEEEKQLQQAIQMSLQQDDTYTEPRKVEDSNANDLNTDQESSRYRPIADGACQNDDDDDDGFSLHAALSEARKTKRKPLNKDSTAPGVTTTATPNPSAATVPSNVVAQRAGFDGPLPFEKLNLGTSLLGKKKMQKYTEELEGGFEREPMPSELKKQEKDKKESAPLPPWFAGGDANIGANGQATHRAEPPEGEKLEEKDDSLKTDRIFEDSSDDEALRVDNSERLDTKETKIERVEDDISSVGSPQSDDFVDVETVKREDRSASMEPQVAVTKEIVEEKTLNDITELRNTDRKNVPKKDAYQNSIDTSKAKVDDRIGNRNGSGDEDDEALEWEESDHEDSNPSDKNTRAKVDASDGIKKLSRTDEVAQMRKSTDEADITRSDTVEAIEELNEAAKGKEVAGPKDELPYSAELLNQQQEATADGFEIQMPNVEDEEDIISDPEEEELIRQLAHEADEHERFTASLNNQLPSTLAQQQQQPPPDFDKQLKALRNQQKKDRRDADEITQTMITECQQLLSLFGLPYITAPMEAEAQCSRLVELGLVDGIVTDDSDIFLFGGNRVYKNMFNQAKFVECYLLPDITTELGLDRHKLIAIAHLLGSDYTEGLPGIGPVTAVELLSEFNDLVTFREWYAAVQQGLRPKSEDSGHPFRRKFRRNATKLFLPPSFPDPVVDDAYINPVVDNDTQPFEWGVPDLASLRSFLSGTVGWTEERTDEILVPVIRDINRREAEGTQANITRFFSGGVGAGAFAPRRRGFVDEGQGNGQGHGSALVQAQLGGSNGNVGRSKRLDTALGKIAGKAKGLPGDVDGAANTNGSASAHVNDVGSTGVVNSDGEGESMPNPPKKKRKSKGPNKGTNDKTKGNSKKRKVANGLE